TLMVGTFRTSAPVSSPQGAVPVMVIADAEATSLVGSALSTEPASEPVIPLPTCVVVPHDSLWKLAEDHLGDGLRWREIWQLNEGRVFPDGRRFHDSNLIQPGWALTMPADAVGLATTTVPVSAPTPAPESPASPAPPRA